MFPSRVCFIAGTLGQGGAERQLFYMLMALKNLGSQVELLTLTSGEFWEKEIRSLGIPIRWVGRHKSRLRRLFEITAAVRRWAPELIQSQHAYTNPYATATGRILRIPVIAAVRNDFISEVQGPGAPARRWGYRHAGVVAANSQGALDAARASGIPRGKLKLLPNVIDTGAFPYETRAVRTPVHILSVGRLVAQKRHDRLLRAIARLRSHTNTPFKATIIGTGEALPSLVAMATDLGVADVVRFAGSCKEMLAAYQDADILTLTSDHEGTPNVVLEAMATGLPVVSSNVGGAADLIRDGETGFLVEREDEPVLVARLCQLVESAPLRLGMGARGRAHVESTYSVNRLSGYLTSLYETALV
ncbi:MAG: glycosyltransferase family 4 protein [Acidobacteriota bacterium]